MGHDQRAITRRCVSPMKNPPEVKGLSAKWRKNGPINGDDERVDDAVVRQSPGRRCDQSGLVTGACAPPAPRLGQ